MSWSTLRFIPWCVLPLACAASQAPAPSAAPTRAAPLSANYRSVHIDSIAPDKMEQFEGARREWLGELHRAHASDGRGVFLQVGANRFYTMRSFAQFSDFDTRGEVINRSLAAVPKGAAERYDRGDTALIFPHASEIWELDPNLGYTPAKGALTEWTATCGWMVFEDVQPDPPSSDRYWSATGEINSALAEGHYPLTRLSFRTVYGSGRVVTLWLAPSRAELESTETVESAVARVRGAARAAELKAACDASVVQRDTQPLIVRKDLTNMP